MLKCMPKIHPKLLENGKKKSLTNLSKPHATEDSTGTRGKDNKLPILTRCEEKKKKVAGLRFHLVAFPVHPSTERPETERCVKSPAGPFAACLPLRNQLSYCCRIARAIENLGHDDDGPAVPADLLAGRRARVGARRRAGQVQVRQEERRRRERAPADGEDQGEEDADRGARRGVQDGAVRHRRRARRERRVGHRAPALRPAQGQSRDPGEQALHLREGQRQRPDLHLPRVRLLRQRRVRRVHRQRRQRHRLRRQLQERRACRAGERPGHPVGGGDGGRRQGGLLPLRVLQPASHAVRQRGAALLRELLHPGEHRLHLRQRAVHVPVPGDLREARPAHGDPGLHHGAGAGAGGRHRLRLPQGQGVRRRRGVPGPRHRAGLARHLLRHLPLQDRQPGRMDEPGLHRQHRHGDARRVQLHRAGRRRDESRAMVAPLLHQRRGQVPHHRLHQRQGVAAGVLLLMIHRPTESIRHVCMHLVYVVALGRVVYPCNAKLF